MKSTKLLVADHEIILEALHILEAINHQIECEKPVDKWDIRLLLNFFRDFADGFHHVKEESILFPALMQAGMAMQEDPLRMMAYEHERGRALMAAMNEALCRDDNSDFIMYARRYTEVLTEHIGKENSALFEVADQRLSDDEDQKIADAFEHFEQNIVGTATYQRFREDIEILAAKYLGMGVQST